MDAHGQLMDGLCWAAPSELTPHARMAHAWQMATKCLGVTMTSKSKAYTELY